MAIEPGVDGGGFEGGDCDEDASPVEEEGDSELDDKDSDFSVGSSASVESSSSCAGGVSSGCLELIHRGAFTAFPVLTERANELENRRGRAENPRRKAGAARSKANIQDDGQKLERAHDKAEFDSALHTRPIFYY